MFYTDKKNINYEQKDAFNLLTLFLLGVMTLGLVPYLHEYYPIVSDLIVYTFLAYLVLLVVTKVQQFISWFKKDKD